MTAALTVKRSAAGSRPDDRQRLLISLVRERDAAGTSRQLEAWVHRRGLASLQAFRSDAVPELLSAADDAWLEGCLHEPLEQRLLKLDALVPAPQDPAASAPATPASAGAAPAAVTQVNPDPAALALADAAIATDVVRDEAVANWATEEGTLAGGARGSEPAVRDGTAIGLAPPPQQGLGQEQALEPQPQAEPQLGRGALGGLAEGFRPGPDADHGGGDEGCAEPLTRLVLESPAATDPAVSDPAALQTGIGFGDSPSGQGSALTPQNPPIEVALEEPPLPLPSPAWSDAEWLETFGDQTFGDQTLGHETLGPESFGLEAWAALGRHDQDLPETPASAEFNAHQQSGILAEGSAQACTESRAEVPGFASHTEVGSAVCCSEASSLDIRSQASIGPSSEVPVLNNRVETSAVAGSDVPALDNDAVAAAVGLGPLDGAGSEGTWCFLAESPERQEPGHPARLSPFEAIASAPPSTAQAGVAPQQHKQQQDQTTNLPSTAEPSRYPGLGRGLSSAGSALADAPQRLRRKLFGSLGKARLLMRACLEEAMSTLHPHGDAVPEEQAPPNAATPAASVEASPERLGSSWPGGDSPLAAAAQPASHPSAAPIPPGANAQGMKANRAEPIEAEFPRIAPAAAWSRSRGNSLPAASLDVPLQGPPAPAPAHLADLRAWLPGSSDQNRRAS